MIKKRDENLSTINPQELTKTKKTNQKIIIRKKREPLTIKEEEIIKSTEEVGKEMHSIENLRHKISESIRNLFEYYKQQDDAPEEIKNAA